MVAVNARFFSRPTTGVERYAEEIACHLKGHLRFLAPLRPFRGVPGHLWEQVVLPSLLKKDEVLWSPANTGPLAITNQVVTVHDLSFIDHPEWFRPAVVAWYRHIVPELARRAAMVITDSTYSFIRIVDTFRISERKVRIVPCGVDLDFFKPQREAKLLQMRQKYRLPETYALVVGSMQPRKNLKGLFQAWKKVRRSHGEIELVLVGDSSPFFKNEPLIEPSSGVRVLGFVEDDDLPALFSGARVYINPSFYEGFGLTILEAMACGTPVISSDTTSLPEVVGEAGLLVNPEDPEEIALGINAVLMDDDLAGELVRRGFDRVRAYPWKRSAEKVWEVLCQVAE